ncbi:7426_t:CDS:2, partial [Entrophospora sp. SA101]
ENSIGWIYKLAVQKHSNGILDDVPKESISILLTMLENIDVSNQDSHDILLNEYHKRNYQVKLYDIKASTIQELPQIVPGKDSLEPANICNERINHCISDLDTRNINCYYLAIKI